MLVSNIPPSPDISHLLLIRVTSFELALGSGLDYGLNGY